MNSNNSVDWNFLLDTNKNIFKTLTKWSMGDLTTREVANKVSNTEFSSEFRKLVRNNGTTYGRRLARKALRYRGEFI